MDQSPRLYRIGQPFDGRLAVSRRPLGDHELEREVAGWRAAGLDMIVSMLEPEEAEDLGLGLQELHCRQHGIDFISCPVSDHGVPDDTAPVIACAERALVALRTGKQVAAHCFAGIGRSPLFVATVLVLHGLEPDTAWDRINMARGMSLPDTDAQWQWVADLAGGLHQKRAPVPGKTS